MTNLEKLRELMKKDVSKEDVKEWAYFDNIYICTLEHEFKEMEHSVAAFYNTGALESLSEDIEAERHKAWDLFLESEFVDC